MNEWLNEARLKALYPAHLQTQAMRAATALAHSGYERLVIFSGAEKLAFRDDAPYPFIPNPYFKAWLPLLAHPDSALVITPDQKPELIYVEAQDYWHMPPAAPHGYWVEHFNIHPVRDAAELPGALPADLSRCAAIGEAVTLSGFAAVNDPGLLQQLDYPRAIKTDYEIECIAAANRRAAPAHQAARRAFFDGASEFEIHQAYCRVAQHTDPELPYGNIIALNEHAAVLHYQVLDRQPPIRALSFLIDAGAACQGYAADITRTWTAEADFNELITALEDAQQSLCGQIRPGLEFAALHDRAHQAIAAILVDADIARGSAEEVYSSGISRYFLPHGLGHLLGLQVHDVGGHMADARGGSAPPPEAYPWLRLTRTLEPGFVVTMEPGLYFIPLLLAELRESPLTRRINWPRVEALARYGGIRIEDNVVVEDTGHRNLTREAFAALE